MPVTMQTRDLDINPRIIESAERGGFGSPWKILETPIGIIRTRTGLQDRDVESLVDSAAIKCCPTFTTVLDKAKTENNFDEEFVCIKTGCPKLDKILGGGFPLGKVTEIAGESSSGKTQMALTLAIQAQLNKTQGGVEKEVAYICTETQFPFVRLNQMVEKRTDLKSHNLKPISDNIFVHHVSDMKDLVNCACYQLPAFIKNNNVGAILIDSVAAVFRADDGTQKERSKMTQKLGYKLHELATTFNVAVIVINQVSANFSSSMYGLTDDVTPSLGLAWANLITTRLMLRKLSFSITRQTEGEMSTDYEARIRSLEVIFCPWLPRKSSSFIISQKGIEDIHPLSTELHLT